MTAGLFALAGVLLGALTSGAVNWFFQRRTEQRELLVAVRLVREDVVLAGPSLETLLRRGWFEELELDVEAWPSHRAMCHRDRRPARPQAVGWILAVVATPQ